MTETMQFAAATRRNRWAGIPVHAMPVDGSPMDGTPVAGVPQQDLIVLLGGLERRLASQPLIEQSKGILMGRFGIDPDTAFALLRRWSSRTNVKLRDISQMLVTAAVAPQRTDARRVGQELADLIDCLNQR